MKVALCLGSNLGDRELNIRAAISRLPLTNIKISDLIVTKALLKEGSPASWNMDFINCVITGDTNLEPLGLLKAAKEIEKSLGRVEIGVWSPREIDIDILLYGNLRISTPELTIPHAEMHNRDFVMELIEQVAPDMLSTLIPKVVGILNVTPDSFSDGGRHYLIANALQTAKRMVEAGVSVIDIGAESTRPGASIVSPVEEINRLSLIISEIKKITLGTQTRISLDSRNAETISEFINYIDIINDVTGLENQDIQEIAIEHNKQAIVMHSLSIPANPNITLPKNIDVIKYMQKWFDSKLLQLQNLGFNKSNLIFDPGIGFGLNSEQSMTILRRLPELDLNGIDLMIGHSRKSFLSTFGKADPRRRDPETHNLTMYLLNHNKINYIRVHDFEGTLRILNTPKQLYS